MGRIKVPEGMLKAAERFDSCDQTERVLEEALQWWTENGPPLMKRFDFNPFEREMEESPDGDYLLYVDVKDMFLRSEPKVERGVEEVMNELTVEINKIGMTKAIEVLRTANR